MGKPGWEARKGERTGGREAGRRPVCGLPPSGASRPCKQAQERGDLLHALGAQGCNGEKAPLGQGPASRRGPRRQLPRRAQAKPPKSKHWLGSGQRLEPRRPLRVDSPSRKPTDAAAGQVRDHYHPREPLRTPLGEQARSLQPVAAESVGFKVLAQPVPRVEADAPGRQLLTRLGAAKRRPEVEPCRRRQQRWVPLGNYGGTRTTRSDLCPGSSYGSGHRPGPTVQPLYRLGQA